MSDDLAQQLLGRSKFLVDRGEVKSPDLLRAAADEITTLRAQLAASETARVELVDAVERDAAVAWLRKAVHENWLAGPYHKAIRAEVLADAANAIERGDHIQENK